ncbi:MAG: hypothetical protein JXB15_04930 [Anaerolineales bacterium]|nr:hypothetical protein [Anaerolineales bacterium]
MNQSWLQQVCLQVYRRFPDMRGQKPSVKSQPPPGNGSGAGPARYMLTFRSRLTTSDRKSLPRWVRVTVDGQGKILKISTSH